MLKYMKFFKNKVKKYDKLAKNPFYNAHINYENPKTNSTIFEKTYLWVERNDY